VVPLSVRKRIAEALITTAAGLVIAIFTLFPYNSLRAQINRSLSAIESLALAAVAERDKAGPSKADQAQDDPGTIK